SAAASMPTGGPSLRPWAGHDKKVGDALKQLANEVDVIVLAQASMARVVDTLTEAEKKVPILASPPIAMEYLKTLLTDNAD
ncbi:MAG: hypothetical protein ACOVP7_08325, partial [Lacibacter sp.]